MMRHIADGADHIYLALGSTDFRKQAKALSAAVSAQYNLNPYDGTCVFLFCNRKRTALRALRWDSNGWVLATKYLSGNYKFQWPKNAEEIRTITQRQLDWLLSGLMIDQPKALPENLNRSGWIS